MNERGRERRGGGGAGPTLADIAKAAGVSTATVSRVLNAPDSVKAERALRVRQAIDSLGYLPNGSARALASRRSMTIGAVIPTFDNAIFAKGLEAFQTRLQEAGYALILASSGYGLEEEARLAETLLERRVDGLMLVGMQHAPGLLDRLAALDVPHVLSWAHDRSGRLPCIGFDNGQAAAAMARHLVGLGHRNIAMIAGRTEGNDRARDRVAGVRAVLAELGESLPANAILEVPYSYAQGREAMRWLMSRTKRPSAVICGNDVLAIGAVLGAQDAGLDVPGDVSIAGFDDLPLAGELRPALTTMRVPAEEMGRQAAEWLLSALAGDTPGMPDALPVELVVRQTTGVAA